jgi:hypothetical protein
VPAGGVQAHRAKNIPGHTNSEDYLSTSRPSLSGLYKARSQEEYLLYSITLKI